MTIFNEVFLICLLIGAVGGLIHALIRIIRNLDTGSLDRSKVAAWLLLYPLIGAAAGFIAWLLSLLMDGDAGVYFAAFLAGLGGIPAIEAVLRSQGIASERDLLAKSRKRDIDTLTPLKKRLEQTDAELKFTQQRLTDALAKLEVATEREQLRNEIEELLEERIVKLSASNPESKEQEPQPKAEEDDDSASKQSKK